MKQRRKPVRRTISQRSELINDFHAYGINPDLRELVLMSSAENPEDGITWTAANTFIKNLLLLNSMNHTSILVHQCTCGGDWNYGMAIYDAIAASPSPVTILAYAHARSMSSIIPQAAKRRVIMPNCDFLTHFGVNAFDGDDRSFIAEGRWAEKLGDRMLGIYVSRCSRGPFFRRNKYSKERVREYLKRQLNSVREWYLTAEDSVDLGFMDGVFGTPGFKTFEEIRSQN